MGQGIKEYMIFLILSFNGNRVALFPPPVNMITGYVTDCKGSITGTSVVGARNGLTLEWWNFEKDQSVSN